MSPVINGNQRIAGCRISPLDEAACQRYLGWLAGETDRPDGADGIAWALGHFDDGVTWGRWDRETTSWATGHDVAPDVSPAIRVTTLQELRFFGDGREVLIWRTPMGLRGREVTETDDLKEGAALAPVDESRILRGAHVQRELDPGFTHVADGTGARQVLPMRVTDQQLRSQSARLLVRHYFERDDGTGTVRVALTRLVALCGGQHGA